MKISLIFGDPKHRFSPKAEHCSKPRGYPRKIFWNVLANIYTNTKKYVNIFWDGSMTSKKSLLHPRFCIPEQIVRQNRYQTHEADPQPAPIPRRVSSREKRLTKVYNASYRFY